MARNSIRTTPTTEPSRYSIFQTLQNEFDNVFDRLRHRSTDGDDAYGWPSNMPLMPALDVAESDEMVEVTAEIPGAKESDLDVSVTGGVLTIKGEKSSDRREDEKDYHLVERRYGSFSRRVNLGFDPEGDANDAKFADGVLRIKIGKPAEAKSTTQKIEIKSK